MGKKKKRKSSAGFFRGIIGAGKAVLLSGARILPVLFILGGGAAVYLGVKQALYADSGLTISKITVLPSQAISVIQRERLESQYLGKNILRADLNKIAGSLEKDPSIQSAVVNRRIPSELFIEVTKRNPVAFIRFGNQAKCGVISQDGMILDVVDEKAATGLMIEVSQAAGSLPSIGQFFHSQGYREAIKFLEAYQDFPLSRQEPVTKVFLDPLGNVSVYLQNGPEIRLGRRPSQRLEGFKKIGPLLESEMRKKIEYLDLQYDDVIVKQKRGSK